MTETGLAKIEQSGVITETGYDLPPGIDFDTWQQIGEELRRAEGAVQWWIGDWLVYGKQNYQEGDVGHNRYYLAIEAIERSHGTLKNYSSVAWRVASSRRRDDLPFSHHIEVANLDPDGQERMLALAKEHRWSVQRLRSEVRARLSRPRQGDNGSHSAASSEEPKSEPRTPTQSQPTGAAPKPQSKRRGQQLGFVGLDVIDHLFDDAPDFIDPEYVLQAVELYRDAARRLRRAAEQADARAADLEGQETEIDPEPDERPEGQAGFFEDEPEPARRRWDH